MPALAVLLEGALAGQSSLFLSTPRRVLTVPNDAGQRLAVQPLQLRLGVERLDVARPAGHEQEDDALGLGGVMAGARRQRAGFLGEQAIVGQQRGERDGADAAAGLAQPIASRQRSHGQLLSITIILFWRCWLHCKVDGPQALVLIVGFLHVGNVVEIADDVRGAESSRRPSPSCRAAPG